MATTRLSDVIVPAVFEPYAVQRTLELSNLYRSGILANDAGFDALASGEGSLFTLPFFNDLTGDSNVSSDDPAQRAVPNKITTGADAATKLMRNQSWSSMDLVAALLDRDPMRVIADRVAAYWAREMQKVLLANLQGVMAANVANNASDMVVNVALSGAGTPTAANRIGPAAVLAAKQTLGDASDTLTGIVMHSAEHTELQRQQVIVYDPPATADVGFGTYLGHTVIVDDGVPAVVVNGNVQYTTFLFGRGAVAFGNGAPKTPIEIERDALSGNGEGQEILVSRRHFIQHLRGVRWLGAAVAGASPTNAELANPANYSRVYARKSIRFAALVSN